MARHSNDTYLAAIRNNERKVLQDYYLDFYPGIRRFVLKNSGTEEDARDIFGDVTEAVLRKIKSSDLVLSCKLNTFLTEIGARLWLKKLRRKKFDSGVTTDDPAVLKYITELEQPLELTEQFTLYRSKFELLDDGCRQVLRLGIQEGKSYEEVMEMTGHTYDYARKIRAKCLKKLTALIKADPLFKELSSGRYL